MPYKDKEVARKKRNEWWSKLPKERKDEKQKKSTARAKMVKVFIAEYKLKSGCIDCGYNKHHSALDFDHVNGDKKINVCFAKSRAQALDEIQKCEIVCSNCHRIRTFNRLYPLSMT